MTDFGRLKAALAEAGPGTGFRPPDLVKIMADGGRLRWRRRIAFGAVALTTVALTAVALFAARMSRARNAAHR